MQNYLSLVFGNIYQNEVNLWLKQKVLFSWGKKYYILLKLNKKNLLIWFRKIYLIYRENKFSYSIERHFLLFNSI